MNITYKPFLNKVASIFNLTDLDILGISPIYDTIVVDKFLGRSIPSSFT